MINTITEMPKPRGCGCTFNIETVALVIAVIKSVVFSLLAFFFVIGTIIMMNEDRGLAALVFLTTVILLTTTAFTMVLTRGLLTKNVTLLKIYFSFGVTLALFLTAISMALGVYPGETVFKHYKSYVNVYNVIAVYTIAFFAVILMVVRATYRKFERRAAYRSRYEDNLLLLNNNEGFNEGLKTKNGLC